METFSIRLGLVGSAEDDGYSAPWLLVKYLPRDARPAAAILRMHPKSEELASHTNVLGMVRPYIVLATLPDSSSSRD